MPSRAFLLAVLVCAIPFGDVGRAVAQGPESNERDWEAAVRYDYERLSDERRDWQQWTVSIKRETSDAALMATVLRQRRFGLVDKAVQIDVWYDLWSGAYAHIRTGMSPNAHVRPRGAIQAQIFETFGPWELEGQYRWRRYKSEDVNQVVIGVGRYIGLWYLRTRTSMVPRSSTWGFAQRFSARRFYGSRPSLSYVDIGGGLGRNVELINSRSDILLTRTLFLSVRVRHLLTSRIGITASLRYGDKDVFHHTGGTLGLFGRW